MTWFKIDDSFYDHPKVFDAPDCAVALWVRAGTWSARNLTDGFVPARMPARMCDDPDTAVKELVRRGLWSRTKDGFKFHDWSQYQPSRESVEDLRTKRAEAGKRGGQAKAAKQNGKQNSSNGLANASGVAKQNAAPTRPDPTRSGLGGGVPHGGRPDAGPEPPRECPEHIGDPDPPRCGACGDARRRHQAWEADQNRTDQARRSDQARERAELRRAEIDACRQCDDHGYLASGVACRHRAMSTTGAAAVRAALAAAQPSEED